MSIFTERYNDPPAGIQASAGACMGEWPYGKNPFTVSGYPCNADLVAYGVMLAVALVAGLLLLWTRHRRAAALTADHGSPVQAHSRSD